MPLETHSSISSRGTYSDVYSLGSVILYMITRMPPMDIFYRLQNDTVIDQLNEMPEISEEWKDLIISALVLKKEERPHDIGTLISLIETKTHDNAANIINEPQDAVRIKRPLSRRTVLIAGCSALLLAGAAVWTISGFHYKQAILHLDARDYEAARDEIERTLLIYNDTEKLAYYIDSTYFMSLGYYDEAKSRFETLDHYKDSPLMVQQCDYLKAQNLLGNGEFSLAKALFASLGEYSDSDIMVLECDYREAKHLLGVGDFDKAKDLFGQLASKNYKDTQTMILETDYQCALSFYSNYFKTKDVAGLGKALALLNSIRGYSDVAERIKVIEVSIYKEALSNFNSAIAFLEAPPEPDPDKYLSALVDFYENIKMAKKYFSLIEGYSDADSYLSICDFVTNQSDSDTSKNYAANYVALLKLWSFEPARRIVLGNTYIYYFLKGTWRGDGHYFKLSMKSDGRMTSSYNIPWFSGGDYYTINGLIYYIGSDEKGWTEMFEFDIVNQYIIKVYAFKNGRTYTLVRQ